MSIATFNVDEKDPAVATVEEAAAYLRVSTWSVYKRIQEGSLKAVRVGRSVRIPVKSLRAYAAGESV